MTSRLETNFVRLLTRCETMASSEEQDWRLERYVRALYDQLDELNRLPSKPDQLVLKDYRRKVDLLKAMINARKLDTISAKVLAVDSIPVSSSIATSSHIQNKEVLASTKHKLHNELRQELMGRIDEKPQENGGTSLRHRGGDDIDSVLQHHNQMQEKIANEMLSLARNLKQNAWAAGKVIQEDNSRLVDSNKLASANFSKLKTESERLEVHTKKSCNWWVWIMLVIVCLTFVWMVLFIRLFPRR